MAILQTIQDYLRMYAPELGQRIVEMYPALHTPADPVSSRMKTLLRTLPRSGAGGHGSGPALGAGANRGRHWRMRARARR